MFCSKVKGKLISQPTADVSSRSDEIASTWGIRVNRTFFRLGITNSREFRNFRWNFYCLIGLKDRERLENNVSAGLTKLSIREARLNHIHIEAPDKATQVKQGKSGMVN